MSKIQKYKKIHGYDKEAEEAKKKAWREEFRKVVSWGEFNKEYTWCCTCKSWQEGICICYAR